MTDTPTTEIEQANDDAVEKAGEIEGLAPSDPENVNQPAPFIYITENDYVTERNTTRDRKHSKKMVCVCQFDPETDDPEEACGDNCLNRILMIECGSRCPSGEYCRNRRFQKAQYANVEVFKTEKKGWGLRAKEKIKANAFVMEYCGEVLTAEEFEDRKREYGKQKRRHYYFMSLRNDEILDATLKGNLSRFINHSCDPNCETQKWTVSGLLRVGFFSLRDIECGDEITFDYQFQRFGERAQKCFCGSANCRDYLGGTKQVQSKPAKESIFLGTREGRRKGRQTSTQNPEDAEFEKEIFDIVGSGWKLKDNGQVLAILRTMLQAETPTQRVMLLQVLQATEDIACLKKFLSLHGLRLLWSWMVDLADTGSPEMMQFKLKVLETLEHLPVTTRNQLDETKLLSVIGRWKDKSSPRGASDQGSGDTDGEGKAEKTEGVTVEGAIINETESKPVDEGTVKGPTVAAEKEEGNHETEPHNSGADEQDGSCSEETLAERAAALLDKWSALKEVYRIPKKASKQPKSGSPEEAEKSDCDGSTLEEEVGGGGGGAGNGSGGRDCDRRVHSLKPQLPPIRSTKRHSHLRLPKVVESTSTLPQSSSTASYVITSNSSNSPNPSSMAARTFQLAAAPPFSGSSIIMHQTGLQEAPVLATPTTLPSLHVPPCAVPVPASLQASMIRPSVVQFSTTWAPSGLLPTPVAFATSTAAAPSLIIPQPQQQPQQFVAQQVFLPPSQAVATIGLGCLPPALPVAEDSGLPPNWRAAKDGNGKVYYYHIITRKSQWERPTPGEVTGSVMTGMAFSSAEVSTTAPEHSQCTTMADDSLRQRGPHTPGGSPLSSPTKNAGLHSCSTVDSASGGRVAEDTEMDTNQLNTSSSQSTPSPLPDHSPSGSMKYLSPHSPSSSPKSKQKKLSPREAFRHKLSKIVIHCLDQHRKPDCKYGRITCSEDFKYLARRLTYGLTEKERGRKKELLFTDSVKSKVKEYIRQYMKKFGPIYKKA